MNIKKTFAFLSIAFAFNLNAFSLDRPIVKDLTAISLKGTKINVSWTVPEKTSPVITRLFVYRTTKPAGSFFDLVNEKPVAVLDSDSSSFMDSVHDYKDYYYSVIAEVEGKPYDIILPSINSTVNSVHLKIAEKEEKTVVTKPKEKLYTDGNLRETPLPYLDLLNGMNRKKISMKDSTIAYAKELGAVQKKEKKMEPYVFEEDLVSPDGGDDFLLFEVLRTTFIQKNYPECIKELDTLLGTNSSNTVAARAGFYLGESYYFSKDYKNAVSSFLKVYDSYPKLAKKWIDSSLEKIKIEER